MSWGVELVWPFAVLVGFLACASCRPLPIVFDLKFDEMPSREEISIWLYPDCWIILLVDWALKLGQACHEYIWNYSRNWHSYLHTQTISNAPPYRYELPWLWSQSEHCPQANRTLAKMLIDIKSWSTCEVLPATPETMVYSISIFCAQWKSQTLPSSAGGTQFLDYLILDFWFCDPNVFVLICYMLSITGQLSFWILYWKAEYFHQEIRDIVYNCLSSYWENENAIKEYRSSTNLSNTMVARA